MNSMQTDTAKITRRILFFVLLAILALSTLLVTFRGLSDPLGIDQAQLGREIARGNGYTSQVIRPASIYLMENNGQDARLDRFNDTYHAPLNPLMYAAILKITGGDQFNNWMMDSNSQVYQPDRIIAATCIIFFLIAIGINYLLIARIFDTSIAAVVALLMLFCEMMWEFSQSGLPQMLMLMLFSCAMFFAWKAMENAEMKKPVMAPAFLSGIFLALLVLTHWITIWIVIGYLVFAAIFFQPRGLVASTVFAIVTIFTIPTLYLLYIQPTGTPVGSAFYNIYNGIGGGMSEMDTIRSLNPTDNELAVQGLMLQTTRTILTQITSLYSNLGSVLAAPIFFLALLHPFKRESLRNFRWGILLMWVFACIGMAIFGLGRPNSSMNSNQIHILFMPLMSAYGVAMVSILWSRVAIPQMKFAHYFVLIAISAGPLLLAFPQEFRNGMRREKAGGAPSWPMTHPLALNTTLTKVSKKSDLIISDQPECVAWYADRTAILLPKNQDQIEQIESRAEKQQLNLAGIFITPRSFNAAAIMNNGYPTNSDYGELFPLVYNYWSNYGNGVRGGNAKSFLDTNPDFKTLTARYKYPVPILGRGLMMYYSKELPVLSK
ncbi:phospholipid carrier-dependent glycosyltransferase [Persicirhabdus sediminis]|uniref:Phospholipid carrier-dependent glycosyltransferase n=1 Tax=Persicirhabdus sediminis TaxID=454144 RepID=A0A8J7SJK1_9BACT|nr:phospholipid carrier-dependent glycosyltransferase [Persicirhabdus sediminis]MBK1791171.1 phospholipid carrier-dependent glycosyltransferase [Persicirhabdus sediminis]